MPATPTPRTTTSPDPVPVRRAAALTRALLTVDGVAALHPGQFGEVALLYPRGRVPGLRVTPGHGPRLEVHVVVDVDAYRRPLSGLAAAVRDVVTESGVDLPVDVVFADATDAPDRTGSPTPGRPLR